MGKTGLKIGVLLLILGIVIGGVCLLLPTLTSNRVSLGESAFGFIPAGVFFLLGFIFTIFSLIFIARTKKAAAIYKPQLESEGIIFFEEDVSGSMTFRNFHRPGAFTGWQKIGISTLLALTEKRLLALKGSNPIIDVPLTDERLRKMNFSLENETTLLVAFDANLFQPEWSGEIEYRFKTAKAKEFLQKLNEMAK